MIAVVDVAKTVCEVLGQCPLVNVGDAEAAPEALRTGEMSDLTDPCLPPAAISSGILYSETLCENVPDRFVKLLKDLCEKEQHK